MYSSTMPRFSLEARDPSLVFIGKTVQSNSGQTNRGTMCYSTDEWFVYAKKEGNAADKIVVVTITTMNSNHVVFLPKMFQNLSFPHELARETIDGKSLESCFCLLSSPGPVAEALLIEKGIVLKPVYAANILGGLLGGISNGSMQILYLEASSDGMPPIKETLMSHRDNAFNLKFKSAITEG